jgi:4-hydroxy-tetrahydrodipicolinate synthase
MTLQGIFAPTLTPVHSDLSPDVARLADHCRRLLQEGCHGLAVFGTTSEANSFSVEERMAVLDQLVEAGVEPVRLMPGTGCAALPDTVRLTAHATGLGCAGVLMLPPFYYKSVSDDGLFRSYAEVTERVGDRRLRIYLYHIPPVSQVPISLNLIERLRTAYPDTVVGIKDSSGDWNNLKAILTNFPGFGTFSGSEALLLETLRHGGAGTICAPANVIAGLLRNLYDHWESHAAEQMQADVLSVRQATQAMNLQPIPALKAIVARRLEDPAWHQVRPPLTALTQEKGDALMAALAGKL